MKKKKNTGVFVGFSDSQNDLIYKFARMENITMTQYVRRATQAYLRDDIAAAVAGEPPDAFGDVLAACRRDLLFQPKSWRRIPVDSAMLDEVRRDRERQKAEESLLN